MTKRAKIAPLATTAAHGSFGVTLFEGVMETNGHRASTSWESLVWGFADKVVDATSRSKESLPGWSPAHFSGNVRKKANVEHVFALALDYDNAWEEILTDGAHEKHPLPPDEIVTVDAALAPWAGARAWTYTSYSHQPQWPRFRLVVPFARAVTADEYVIVWAWARERLKASKQVIDEQCKDPSRLWFRPARRNEHFQQVLQDGDYLDVDAILGGAR
jgi:hypothetical protein